jgi:acyl-coenzyme A synthetase/AMP-(fatty) acid ligase
MTGDDHSWLSDGYAAVSDDLTLCWYAAPRRLHVHGELPRTESGKVRRHVLREEQAQ